MNRAFLITCVSGIRCFPTVISFTRTACKVSIPREPFGSEVCSPTIHPLHHWLHSRLEGPQTCISPNIPKSAQTLNITWDMSRFTCSRSLSVSSWYAASCFFHCSTLALASCNAATSLELLSCRVKSSASRFISQMELRNHTIQSVQYCGHEPYDNMTHIYNHWPIYMSEHLILHGNQTAFCHSNQTVGY